MCVVLDRRVPVAELSRRLGGNSSLLNFPAFHSPEFSSLRLHYQHSFERVVRISQGTVQRSLDPRVAVSGATPSLQASAGPEEFFQTSRYETEYTEVAYLARGGFGAVFRAANKLDGCEYAVKKVVLRYYDRELCAKILREVTTLARLSHPNVVCYKTAWLEPFVPSRARRNRRAIGLVQVNTLFCLQIGAWPICEGSETIRPSLPEFVLHARPRMSPPRPRGLQTTATIRDPIRREDPTRSLPPPELYLKRAEALIVHQVFATHTHSHTPYVVAALFHMSTDFPGRNSESEMPNALSIQELDDELAALEEDLPLVTGHAATPPKHHHDDGGCCRASSWGRRADRAVVRFGGPVRPVVREREGRRGALEKQKEEPRKDRAILYLQMQLCDQVCTC